VADRVVGGRVAHTTTGVAMDTLVSATAVVEPAIHDELAVRRDVAQALEWFGAVERVCSRFDAGSEVVQLAARPGQAVAVSAMLFELTRVALALARLTDGAFDPTVGGALSERGFNRHYLTGAAAPVVPTDTDATFRDVRVDARRRTVTLERPVLLDLSALAKGLAIDLAAQAMAAYADFCVEAGGDLYVKGRNAYGAPWRIGIQHPLRARELVRTLVVSDGAVCTSGGYERLQADGRGHHLIDGRTRRSPGALASVTVIAPTALAADGLATAAFLLGPDRGTRLLQAERVRGVFVLPSLAVRTTEGFETCVT
jgi:thiamine biosynthesis lipoprotein